MIKSEYYEYIYIEPTEPAFRYEILTYLELMDDSLFQSIESIVDYIRFPFSNWNYIIVFDINDRPYYCVVIYDKEIYNYIKV